MNFDVLLRRDHDNNDRRDHEQQRRHNGNNKKGGRSFNGNTHAKLSRNFSGLSDDSLEALERGKQKGDDQHQSRTSKRNQKEVEGAAKKSKKEMQLAILEDFVSFYVNNKTDTVAVLDLIQDQLPDVASIMAQYEFTKDEDAIEVMNKVIYLFTTKLFATALLTVFKDDLFGDVVKDNKVRTEIATLISTALDTSSNKMIDDTISIYVEIVTDHIWDVEIKTMVTTLGISEDAAIDTVIAIPAFGSKMTENQLRTYVPKFWVVINQHADTMIDVMDATCVAKYFYHIFPDLDENRQGLKSIGKCMAFEEVPQQGEKEKALYENYITALYKMLNDYDICDIQTVLRYIVKELKRKEELKEDAPLIFTTERAMEYTNIKKAICDLVSNNANAKHVLENC